MSDDFSDEDDLLGGGSPLNLDDDDSMIGIVKDDEDEVEDPETGLPIDPLTGTPIGLTMDDEDEVADPILP